MQPSLSRQLLRNLMLAVLMVGAISITLTSPLFDWKRDMVSRHQLESTAAYVTAALRFDPDGSPREVDLGAMRQNLFDVLRRDAIYRVLDEQGKVVLASDDASAPFQPEPGPFHPVQGVFTQAPDGISLSVLTTAVQHAGRRYYVQVARSKRFDEALFEQNQNHGRSVSIAVIVILTLLCCVVVALTVRRALRPLRTASREAAAIEPGHLDRRVSTEGMPAEILPVLQAFNGALERLQHGYRVQRSFLATAAHELKTPLTLMRGQVELSGAADAPQLLADIDGMARQVQQLLNLAECSEQQNYVFHELDANAAAADAAQHLARMAQRRGVDIVVHAAAQPVMLRADRGALFVLLKNLLENAIHHAPQDSTVSLTVGAAELTVRDHGRGIDALDMPHLFERFWRGAHRRDSGAGLGLSICHEIAVAHQWRLHAANSAPGALFILAYAPPPLGTAGLRAT